VPLQVFSVWFVIGICDCDFLIMEVLRRRHRNIFLEGLKKLYEVDPDAFGEVNIKQLLITYCSDDVKRDLTQFVLNHKKCDVALLYYITTILSGIIEFFFV